jgi:hypothetical protein
MPDGELQADELGHHLVGRERQRPLQLPPDALLRGTLASGRGTCVA